MGDMGDMGFDSMDEMEQAFDREPTLAGLIGKLQCDKLGAALRAILGSYRLQDMDGHCLLDHGMLAADTVQVCIQLDIEPLGHLFAECGREQLLAPAAALLEQALRQALLNQMISAVHLAAIKADYEDLQRKHAALTESETRYRELARDLEVRVQEQVKIIETAQRQLFQAEKLASVGQLAAGVAHEINNPVGFIRSNLTSAEHYLASLRTLARYASPGEYPAFAQHWKQENLDFVLEDFDALIRESLHGTSRIAAIVKNLRTLSHVDRADVEQVELNEGIRSVLEVMKSRIPDAIRVDLQLQPLPKTMALPAYINQVLMNTIQNAIDSIEGLGTVLIRTCAEGEYNRIDIVDTGRGIAPEVLLRIYDPFFTTKEVGQGTGLGLTVSRDVVLAHEGRIEVASAVGQGTTVSIFLPSTLADTLRTERQS